MAREADPVEAPPAAPTTVYATVLAGIADRGASASASAGASAGAGEDGGDASEAGEDDDDLLCQKLEARVTQLMGALKAAGVAIPDAQE